MDGWIDTDVQEDLYSKIDQSALRNRRNSSSGNFSVRRLKIGVLVGRYKQQQQQRQK